MTMRTTTMMTISVLTAMLGGCSDTAPRSPAGADGDGADIDLDKLMAIGPDGEAEYQLDPGESAGFGVGRLAGSWQFSLAQDTGAMRMEIHAHGDLIAAAEGEQLTVTAVTDGVFGSARVHIQNIGEAAVSGTVTFEPNIDVGDARSDPDSIVALAGGKEFELAPGEARGYGPGGSSGTQEHAVTSDGRVRVEVFSREHGELLSRAVGKNVTLTTVFPEFFTSPIIVVSNMSQDYVTGSIDFAR